MRRPRTCPRDGKSSSFGIAERLTCEHADKVASFVAALGGGGWLCDPTRPVPLLTFAGHPHRRGAQTLVDIWVEINACDTEPGVEDLGSGVLGKTYQDCAAHIVFFDIESMGHAWPMHEAKGPGSAWIAEYEEVVDYLEEAFQLD